MIRALFKKQLAEVFSFLFMDTKKKARRTGKGLVGYLLLYSVLIAYVSGMIFFMARFLCKALAPIGLSWFYFTVMSMLALVLGVLGSVFNTYATLYLAKDNDTLLAMPIPPRYILLSRLAGVYCSGLFFELIVMLPTTLAWFLYGEPTATSVVFSLLTPLLLSFFVLSLSCLLGLLVAAISVRIKRKSLVITLASLCFLALYFFGYSKLMSSLGDLLTMAGDIAERVKGPLFPLYHLGLAATGKPRSLLLFAGMVFFILAVVYLLLSRSFLLLATTNKGGVTTVYKRERATQKSVNSALLRKELKRFLSSPTYMLNCGLGALFLPAAGVMLLIFREDATAMLPLFTTLLGGEDILPLLLAAMACMMASMVYISAPSVSLEGKHFWILQSLPVSPRQILHAKLKLHFLIAVPPTVFALICLLIAIPPSLPFFFLIPLATLLFLALIALFGLFMGLNFPNLSWTSETAVVKQSLCVTVTMFGGWATVLALGALYIPLREHISPAPYLALACLLLFCACGALFIWINQKGVQLLAKL